ncbi:MAG: BREX system P-loop protein BrxC [Devosia sp.]|uniref:BREX system P-loop protein BrxC n=1 Tax=Devosia sp. TaxID=1871048 RepID=UPI001A54BDD4|nr:BREX system P-loop protein BrxC [Devosia sp.]MBL8596415.1 BREX system P-loop protein BrxC [Devosia sp.]
MTTLNQIFSKPIDRPIDGVIKADDEASLLVELDEYVITEEIGRRLEDFLDAYNNYSNANGVWISGFFGSGKSHLLKMLALVLENRGFDGVTAYDLFAQKDEIKSNPMLRGALQKAVSMPSRSILFNIDQKADVISKTDTDALLSVFQKVFDEMCGYYGKQPHIAQFERHLDARGKLGAFRDAYSRIAGLTWERGREQALLEKANIAAAFTEVMGSHELTGDILSQYRSDTRVSIEDFANTVKAWIDTQAPGFRLNFFVDEVGQYIAEHVKLMTNLQTIAESLNTRCKGQAWIIVTAQQDMNAIVGDRSDRQEYDFSKIQARFKTKMPLNSADVAEVIQRRLLEKTEEGQIRLGNLYDREEHNLRTLYDFADGSMKLKGFRDRQHFIASYPFPPYEYDLFQLAISELSQHNAFEGKHSSVGERSMLGVFQAVAKSLTAMPVGGMASFDMMFEGIRTALKSSVQQSIHLAERNLDDKLAVRVLKALFLVKYIKGFKPTVRNIAILLMTDPAADQIAERRRIEEALSTLERNTLIQRSGDSYEFLTNEEKDVEQEIKATEIDLMDLQKDLEDLVFDQVIKQRKIKHASTQNEYPFSRKLDGNLSGREHELGVDVISSLSDDRKPDAVKMRSMTSSDVVVLLPDDDRLLRDLTLYRKTLKFVRQAKMGSVQASRDRIIDEKGEQNARRYADIETRLRRLMSDASIFVRGDELELTGDPQDRVLKAFQMLVDKVYVNLPMLRGVTYTETDIIKAASPESTLFGSEGDGLTEAEQEVMNFVQAQTRTGVRVSVKAILENFSGHSYGWPPAAILCLCASLTARGKVESRLDAVQLEGLALAKALQTPAQQGALLLSPQQEFTAGQLRKLKEMYTAMFNRPADAGDAKALGGLWAKGINELLLEIELLIAQAADYPFVTALSPLQSSLKAAADKQPEWYVLELPKSEDALLDGKEDVLDPIRSFMAGAQKTIYDEIHAFIEKNDSNFQYVGFAEVGEIRSALADPNCHKGGVIQGLKNDFYALKASVELKVLEERKFAIQAIDDCTANVRQMSEFQELKSEHQQSVLAHIESHKNGLADVHLIAVLRDRTAGARTRLFKDVMAEILKLLALQLPFGAGEPPAPPPVEEVFVNSSDILVKWRRPFLASEEDVEAYWEANKRTFLAEIRKGRKVIV